MAHTIALDVHVSGALPQNADHLLIVGVRLDGVDDRKRILPLREIFAVCLRIVILQKKDEKGNPQQREDAK